MKHNKVEVYSATRFSDLLASPVFYSTAAIAFLLGLSSIFGFLQSPEKLKGAVDSLAKKVVVLNQDDLNIYVSQYGKHTALLKNRNRYSLVVDKLSKKTDQKSLADNVSAIYPVSFDYDITSKNFWGDWVESNPNVVTIENNTMKHRDSFMIGVPMESDISPKEGDLKYSLKILNRNYRI